MGGQDRYCASNDVHELVHLPNCVLVSNVPLKSSKISGRHPIGLLRFRHHLQVRRGAGHLPNFLCQIWKEVSALVPLTLSRNAELALSSHEMASLVDDQPHAALGDDVGNAIAQLDAYH